jgi:DNA modification methylase
MKAYLQDVEKWCLECKRLLADNGTLFLYGHAKNIAYAQVIFDMHFNLINNLVWDKGSFMGLEESEGLRSFAPCTERILMYCNEEKINECTLIHKEYFISIIEKINETAKYEDFVNCLIDLKIATSKESAKVLASYKIGKHATRFDLLSKEMYDRIGGFKYSYEYLKLEFDNLKDKYQTERRPFVNHFNLQEILRFSNEAQKTGAKYDHDTVKPETLTRALIMTCSRPNDLVVVPFAGSGTECAMAVKEGRKTIGFEITEKHAKMSNDRVQNILRQPSLFFGS